MKKKKIRGLWFFGMSGVGKTYISQNLHKKIKDTVLVDGDDVRKNISTDLGYIKEDRVKQIKRVLGICKIIIKSKKIPIASTVYFNKDLNNRCKKDGIVPIKVERKNFSELMKYHKTYKNKSNVVGLDIIYQNFKTLKIKNENNKSFMNKIKLLKLF